MTMLLKSRTRPTMSLLKDDDGNEPSGKDDRYQALAARYFELQRLFKVDDDDDDDDGKPGTSSQVAK